MKDDKPFLIYIYPYKFTEFIYHLAELENYSRFTEVEIWDISPIVSPEFSNSISSHRYDNNQVLVINSFKNYFSNLNKIRKMSKYKNIVILNEMVWGSSRSFFYSLIFVIMVRGTNVKVLDFFNGGVPLYYDEEIQSSRSFLSRFKMFLINVSSFNELRIKVVNFILIKFSLLFSSVVTHRLVAGDQWLKYLLNNKKTDLTKIIHGHSNDYSSFLSEDKKIVKNMTAVFIDSAGPAFTSDSALLGRKVFFTSEEWYPALSSFFDLIEQSTSLDVKILGHYKAAHISPSPLFGGREVVFGETPRMVRQSDYVITRNSTAISFAVLYKKPIIFVYSNQLLMDSDAMECINGFSSMLGTLPINIDEKIENIEDLLVINEEKYSQYIDSVLTSNPKNMTNSDIILQKLFEINVREVK